MNFLRSLLGSGSGDSFSPSETIGTLGKKLTTTFQDVMKVVMPIVFGVVAALGVFFAIKLGIAYAQTETTEKREEAKKRLIGAIVGFGIGIVAAAIMWWLFTSNAFDSLFK